MNQKLLKAFWNCGDNQIIEFALTRAHLNRNEKEVIRLLLDECMIGFSAFINKSILLGVIYSALTNCKQAFQRLPLLDLSSPPSRLRSLSKDSI